MMTGIRKRIGIPAAGILLLLVSCAGEVEPRVHAGIDSCDYCGMIIDQVNQACGYVLGRQFVTFDSPVCLLYSLESLEDEGVSLPSEIWFADYRDGSFHTAETTTFLLTSHVPTVMGMEVICFGVRDAAESASSHEDEIITDWLGFRTRRGTPDVVVELDISPEGMVPDMVAVNKGDLVLFKVTGRSLREDIALSITGYPEFGTVTIPADGSPVEFRLMATRPGAGFPITTAGGEVFGMMKVEGPHTEDEAAR